MKIIKIFHHYLQKEEYFYLYKINKINQEYHKKDQDQINLELVISFLCQKYTKELQYNSKLEKLQFYQIIFSILSNVHTNVYNYIQ